MQKTVLIGVTSSIAGFKTTELVKLLKKDGISVYVIMTKNAAQMFPIKEFEKESGNKVYFELIEKDFDYRNVLKNHTVEHIVLADSADLMVIVPATANIIAKLAHGLADDFLTTTALAHTKPILICPAMNSNMWQNPVTQENIAKLISRGIQFIEPASGMLACGYTDVGRLADIQTIYEEIIRQLNKSDSLKGKKFIVTAGGTIEKIDDIRNITNRSSGKMGVALAEELHLRGTNVLILRAKNAVKPRCLIKEKLFTTADELYDLIKQNVPNYDLIFHTAAVSDFKVAKPQTGKISSLKPINLKLIPQIKILDHIKRLNPHIKLIAFKAEHGLTEKKLINAAYKRLKETKADVIIANDVSRANRGFEADTNEVLIILPNKKVKKLPLASKHNIAKQILDYLMPLF